MKIEVKRYDSGQREAWSAALRHSKNGLFLFDRDYMDYHADRFADFSAIAYVDGKPSILFPASFDAASAHVFSHKGLTFGGFVVAHDLRTETAIAAIDKIVDCLPEWGAVTIEVRLVPPYLCESPAGEVDFVLWRRGLTVVRRDLSSLLPLDGSIPMAKNKARGESRARKLGVEVVDAPLAQFYPLLEDVLRQRHNSSPVHSLDELTLLQSRFPDRIFARCATLDGATVAGALVYRYARTWHTQYLAASDIGRQLNALDLVIADCIERSRQAGALALSLGTSMDGSAINEGLMWQKESFGARSVVHETMGGALSA